VRERVARSRELVARGFAVAAVTRVLQVSRRAVYRTPTPRTAPQRRPPADPVEQAIVAEALANQSDGYRMVTAFVRRRLGLHGWAYLMAIIDCCTREIVAWQLELRCRADEAMAVVERAAAVHGIQPGELVLGTDNGSAFTARRFREKLSGLGIRHRRGGYRDPESQAFIESWFGKLKEREVWLNEYETLDDARRGIGGYVDRYHHRPHSGLGYRTPDEVRRTWEDLPEHQKQAA
jgi:putative transposase